MWILRSRKYAGFLVFRNIFAYDGTVVIAYNSQSLGTAGFGSMRSGPHQSFNLL